MPNYNSDYIDESIDSVLNQSYQNWELLICDDGSTNSSLKTITEYLKKDSRIIFMKNQNQKGASGARNSALMKATGRFIAFLDSDDIWNKNKLELQLDFMKKNEYAFVFSYVDILEEKGEKISSNKTPMRVNLNRMKMCNFIPCLTAIYDTSKLGKVKQPYIAKRNDYALWLEILSMKNCKYAYSLPIVTAKYRSNSYGLSSDKIEALKFHRKCLIDHAKCSFVESIFYCSVYLFLIILKKVLCY